MRFDDLHWAEQAERNIDAETAEDIVRYRSELGLPVDDAIVAHFLSEFKAERHEGGMWLTEVEAEEQDRIDALIEGAREHADPYIEVHRDDHAGSWRGYGRPEFHVGFARNAAMHREALRQLVPDPDVLHVHEFDFTKAELEAISDQIVDDAEELAAAGVTWMGSGPNPETNRVEVEVVSADADSALAILRQRYGHAITIEWLGPEESPVAQVPWLLWSIDASGRLLTVHYNTMAAYTFARVEYTESENEVAVTVFVHGSVGAVKTLGASRDARVELTEALAGRRVVDGATGREREQRIPREDLDRSWELIHAYAAKHPDEYGGSWAEHPGCHAAFTGHVDTHRRALLALLPEPRALVVHQVERTEADLTALKERIAQERGYLRDRGIRFDEAYIWIDDNAVFLEIEAEDEDAARRFLAARYGPALEVMWVMP